MKLKNMLVITFLVLTFIPIIIVSVLLYKSGFNLSQESYLQNLKESINVQADYISQAVENTMIAEYNFTNRNMGLLSNENKSTDAIKSELYLAFSSYLMNSEDKITACILLDKENVPIYTIGEKSVLNLIEDQLPQPGEIVKQSVMEFDLGNGVWSLGILTPVFDSSNVYQGGLVSIFDKSYLFKIISSYYEITDTFTYLCREDGEIINFKGMDDEKQNASIEQALDEQTFRIEGFVTLRVDHVPFSGYYETIYNSPWYLVGVIDQAQIYTFLNQFIWVYILIIAAVCIADVFLAFYISRKFVLPINRLIQVMDGYPDSLSDSKLQGAGEKSYYETRYLWSKFLELMKKIMLVQHNFEGVYQLYQSGAIEDTNVDIDTEKQTIHSNKEAFEKLIEDLVVPKGSCVVEKFTNCFCKEDQVILTSMFESMRDEHLSVTREAEVFTPYLNQKWFHILVVPMYEDERLSQLFIQLRDISSFKKKEMKSIERANREPLTGLYNRSGYIDCVSMILQNSEADALHGLLFLDMNNFKLVNDTLGHSAGDDLLCSVGRVLTETVGEGDIVSRFGGDEFAVFLPHTSMEAIEAVKKELNSRLVFPYQTSEKSFTISASIGSSTWSGVSPSMLEELLKQADVKMYEEKRKFKQGT